MKFKLTDHRPWYKQVITGIFYCLDAILYIILAIMTGIVLFAMGSTIYSVGILHIVKFFGLVLVAVFAIMLFIGVLGLIFDWAKK